MRWLVGLTATAFGWRSLGSCGRGVAVGVGAGVIVDVDVCVGVGVIVDVDVCVGVGVAVGVGGGPMEKGR
jgi:hypothetical protein